MELMCDVPNKAGLNSDVESQKISCELGLVLCPINLPFNKLGALLYSLQLRTRICPLRCHLLQHLKLSRLRTILFTQNSPMPTRSEWLGKQL
jgi:hypothetical protein